MDVRLNRPASSPGSGMGPAADALLLLGPRRALFIAAVLAILLSLALTFSAYALAGRLPELPVLLIAVVGPMLAVSFCVLPFLRLLAVLERTRVELARHAQVDDRTQAFNRRFFMQMAQREFERARRYGQQMSVLALEPDDFAVLSPAQADAVLRRVAGVALGGTRSLDLVARFEAGRFAVLLPETGGEDAHRVADRLQREMGSAPTVCGEESLAATLSVGVSCYRAGDEALDGLLRRADAALADARQQGGARAVLDQATG